MLGSQARRAVGVACVLMGTLAAAPAAALATRQSASSGIVSATYSFHGGVGPTAHETFTIDRSGQPVYSAPVTSSLCGGSVPCEPVSNRSVHVLNLEGTGEPDVVLDLFSGGASCCTVEQVFSYDPATMTYVKAERNLGQTGAKLEDLSHNGRFEFLTADSSFVCTFTDCADSGAPIEVLAFGQGKFTKVTTRYRKLIARDAARWLKLYRHHLSNGLGLIAPWAADEDLLGHRARVRTYLTAQLKANHLKGPLFSPGGQKFITALGRFLRRHGYVH